jgi:zinc protease
MKDSFAFGMDLVADVARNPAFAPEEIERQTEQAISSLRVKRRRSRTTSRSVLFDRLVYGFHPYGLPAAARPRRCRHHAGRSAAFHRQHFVPNNMVLAIVGDVTSEEAFAAAERVFGKWPRARVPRRKPSIAPPADAAASSCRQARRGADGDPRRTAGDSAQAPGLPGVGSGGEDSRRRRREPAAPRPASERGLTYGAEAETQAMKQAGDFVAETDTGRKRPVKRCV